MKAIQSKFIKLMVWFVLLVLALPGWALPGRASTVLADAPDGPGNRANPAVGTPSPTVRPPEPVVTSTPGADGSVSHTVAYGQTLWDIATTYGVSLAQIQALNNMGSNQDIYPGQKLLIHTAPTPTQSPTVTLTVPPPTRTPRPPTPTRTPRLPTHTRTPAPTLTATTPPSFSLFGPLASTEAGANRRLIGIGLIAFCAIGLVLVGIFGFRRK